MSGTSIGEAVAAGAEDFAFFYDEDRRRPTPYQAGGEYFRRGKDRMDRTFALIAPYVVDKDVLDIGASPFYLLYRAKAAGARLCHGVYFANDDHPLRPYRTIHSAAGPVEISHADVENEGLPFAEDSLDVVTACEILEHFDAFPVKLSTEIRRVLKPGGHLCITVPNVCSIAHILKLIAQKNIYMRYRADATGRHKHEYTLSQLRDYVDYLGMEVVKIGVMPSPTSNKYVLRPFYRLLARIPVLRLYSPVLYVLARQPGVKPTTDLTRPPSSIYEDISSTEED
ncbi:MAG: hypothetical protein A2352_05625 [Caulobacterales bacterium RIFOXYB1_FULL_67_16]|nr:MAG: hypothetical protein A2352_05625 [Caulobacterales bacterium RIFOXYB1_FULL_67_16]